LVSVVLLVSGTPGARTELPVISAEQATAFRLNRQHLVARAPARALRTVLADMNGAQAQLLSAAKLALWSRVRDVSGAAVDRAMWDRRTLVRIWCMRRTVYLVNAADAALYGLGTVRRAEKEIRWMLHHGATRDALESALGELLEALATPRTRTEIAEELARRLRAPVQHRAGGTGWGNRAKTPWVRFGGVPVPITYALHLAGARGVVCLGPVRGAEATYVRADAWTAGWRDMSPREAEHDLVRRYLHTFGPATPHDFAIWSGMTVGDAREVWAGHGEQIAPVRHLGTAAGVWRADLGPLAASSLEGPTVRLLPHFDSALLGHRDHANIVERTHHRKVFRSQGWVSPVVLVNGTVAGVWALEPGHGNPTVRVRTFRTLTAAEERLLRDEVSLLAGFLGRTPARTVLARA
jgi:DNA glycosylase AlkZ-like